MSINKSYAVFGLGKYGKAVALELAKKGAEVIAVDINENAVKDVMDEVPICRCADVTDPEVIKRLGISEVDTAILAMSGVLEASVLTTILCKEAGVKTVIAKCADEMQEKILLKVGADQVIFPEKESGTRLAQNLLSSGFIDLIEIGKNVSIVEVNAREEWIGKSLIELNLRKKYGINVVAINIGDEVITSIDPSIKLEKDAHLVVVADIDKLSKLK